MKAREHLANTYRQIVRTDLLLGAMYDDWVRAGAVCCPVCMFGATWTRLEEKQERRRTWARQLREKLERDSR